MLEAPLCQLSYTLIDLKVEGLEPSTKRSNSQPRLYIDIHFSDWHRGKKYRSFFKPHCSKNFKRSRRSNPYDASMQLFSNAKCRGKGAGSTLVALPIELHFQEVKGLEPSTHRLTAEVTPNCASTPLFSCFKCRGKDARSTCAILVP